MLSLWNKDGEAMTHCPKCGSENLYEPGPGYGIEQCKDCGCFWNTEQQAEIARLREAIRLTNFLLVDVNQLLDGWHNDGTVWTEWDEGVRKSVASLMQKLAALLKETK